MSFGDRVQDPEAKDPGELFPGVFSYMRHYEKNIQDLDSSSMDPRPLLTSLLDWL